MTTPMCTEHRCPTRECEGVTLTRSRFTPVCLCGHPKAVHAPLGGIDCGLCDCLHYESARSRRARSIADTIAVPAVKTVLVLNLLGVLALAACLAVGVGWPLIEAIIGR